MKLSDINIHEVGTTIRMIGAIYADGERVFDVFYPTEGWHDRKRETLDMDLQEWQRFLEQTDLVEVPAFVEGPDGEIQRALVRKSERQISQHVSWAVYRRDHYRCRYCGTNQEPLTVDHLVLWEDGGPSTEDNLVTCCRKCNSLRGNLPYGEWLQSRPYQKVSASLPSAIAEANERLEPTLRFIKKHPMKGKRKR